MVARSAGIEPHLCQALWREQHRPLCLLLDGIDEASTTQREALVAAIEETVPGLPAWLSHGRGHHTARVDVDEVGTEQRGVLLPGGVTAEPGRY